VALETTGPALIRHADLATLHFEYSGRPERDALVACQVELRTSLVNFGPRRKDAWLKLTFSPRNGDAPPYVHQLEPLDLLALSDWPIHERDQPTELEDREQEVLFRFGVPHVHLWWPWELGSQNLYDVTLDLFLGQELSHCVTSSFGFRTVQKGMNDPAIDRWNWALFINKVRYFARGSNYLSDQFPSRMTTRRYREDVQLAKDANMNMLRVFATVERPEFYQVCDELGVLVYQDYPLQWRGYVHTDEFSRACQRQAVELVHLLYNHPSVFLYGGHSEPWNVKVMRELDKPMTAVVRALDPSRPAIYENGTGPEHDLHAWYCGWYGGHVEDIDAWCEGTSAGFIGEFGAQSFPSLEQLRKYPSLTKEDLEVPINVSKLELLNCQPQIFERYLGLERRRDPIEEWIDRSQAYQAELLKAHIETLRRYKYNSINGALTFHFIDNYPGVNWSIVDFWRVPKPAYYAVQKAFRPLHIMASQIQIANMDGEFRLTTEVWFVNDGQHAHHDCRIIWELRDPRGSEMASGHFEGDINPDDLRQVGVISCSLPDKMAFGQYELTLELRGADGNLLSDNQYGFDINITHTGSSRYVA
jgi:beta-mannosidase